MTIIKINIITITKTGNWKQERAPGMQKEKLERDLA